MSAEQKTQFLISATNPDGVRLEDILRIIRNDVLVRCTANMNDGREEVEHVMENNMHILTMLSDMINLAEDSTDVLSRIYGPGQAATGSPPQTD